jgi:hypothetical protein
MTAPRSPDKNKQLIHGQQRMKGLCLPFETVFSARTIGAFELELGASISIGLFSTSNALGIRIIRLALLSESPDLIDMLVCASSSPPIRNAPRADF